MANLPDASTLHDKERIDMLRDVWPVHIKEPIHFNGINALLVALRHIYSFLDEDIWPELADEHMVTRLARSAPSNGEYDMAALRAMKEACISDMRNGAASPEAATSVLWLVDHQSLVEKLWSRQMFLLYSRFQAAMAPTSSQWIGRPLHPAVPIAKNSLVKWDGSTDLSDHVSMLFGIFEHGPTAWQYMRQPNMPAVVRISYKPKSQRPEPPSYRDVRQFTIKGKCWESTDGSQADHKLKDIEQRYRLIASIGVEDRTQKNCVRLYEPDGSALPLPNGVPGIIDPKPFIGNATHSWRLFFGRVDDTPLSSISRELPPRPSGSYFDLVRDAKRASSRTGSDPCADVFKPRERPASLSSHAHMRVPPIINRHPDASPAGLAPSLHVRPTTAKSEEIRQSPQEAQQTTEKPTSAEPTSAEPIIPGHYDSIPMESRLAAMFKAPAPAAPSGAASANNTGGLFGNMPRPTATGRNVDASERRDPLDDTERIKRLKLNDEDDFVHPERLNKIHQQEPGN